jgi:hypothetical protein
MKHSHPKLTGLTTTLSLIGLIGLCSLSWVQAAPPLSSFGVWDRGDTFDPQVDKINYGNRAAIA